MADATKNSSTKLSILNVEGCVDKENKSVSDLSMTIGTTPISSGRLKYNTTYEQRSNDSAPWIKVNEKKDLVFEFTPKHLCFHKQMYSPNVIEADILVVPEEINSTSIRAFIPNEDVYRLFSKKFVTLKCDEQNVCSNYYVHEVIPRKFSDKMYITLKIYSLDKLLTLEKTCNAFVSKKLASEICCGSGKGEGMLKNFYLTNDEKGTKKNVTVQLDYSNMKQLVKVDKQKTPALVQEHIFPYLVQYNESFYDFLARTTNRWGEFLYYEDEKLHIGYEDKKVGDASKDKNTDKKQEDARKVTEYEELTYLDLRSTASAQSRSKGYFGEAPYDDNVLNSKVKKDTYDVVKGTIKNMTDMDMGGDAYLMGKGGSLLGNNKSLKNWLIDTAVDDAVALAQAEARVARKNGKINKEYFDNNKRDSETNGKFHYSDNEYNEFSEFTPIVNPDKYATILEMETLAGQDVIKIEFDTAFPGLKLGEVINVDGALYIVTEVEGYQPEVFTKENNQYYVKGYQANVIKYRVSATAKVSADKFYPAIIPAGHVRKSGPQVAIVVDDDDPNNNNRVRVKYPWQLSDLNVKFEELEKKNLTGIDKSTATPWLYFAAAAGSQKAGIHGRHYVSERVLVDFAHGNVERPYIVGAVISDVPVPLKTGSVVLAAPNMESVKVHEGAGNGAGAFIASLSPGLKLIHSFVPFTFLKDAKFSNFFEGGVEIGDKYGIWSIKGSTDGRNVTVSSAWGDVKINAFTGITISAPNGDIKIQGKNVSIEAGNNLTLTSGSNIKNKFLSTYGDGWKFNAVSLAEDISKAVLKKALSKTVDLVDLSILRNMTELFFKPLEGTLTVTSNRFLKLSAGGSAAGFPDSLYKDPKKKAMANLKAQGTLKMGPVMVDLINSVGPIVDAMVDNYKTAYNNCVAKKIAYNTAVHKLKLYSSQEGAQIDATVCKTYEELKAKLWNPDTTEINGSDLAFQNVDDTDPNAVSQACLTRVYNAGGLGRNRNLLILNKKQGDSLKKAVVDMRKDAKAAVLEAANALLKSIKELQSLSLGEGKANEKIGFMFHAFTKYVPASYVKDMQTAFSKKMCGTSTFYTYSDDDARKNLLPLDDHNQLNFSKTALKRQVALNLAEGWGIKSEAVKPADDAAYANQETWEAYVNGLQYNEMKTLNKESGVLAQTAQDALKKMKFWTPACEYYSWGNAKDGQILFGGSKTLALNADGVIGGISSTYNSGTINSSDLFGKEQRQVSKILSDVKRALFDIDAPFVEIQNENVLGNAEGENIEEPVEGNNN